LPHEAVGVNCWFVEGHVMIPTPMIRVQPTHQCGTVPPVEFRCMLTIRLLARGLNLDEGCDRENGGYTPLKVPTCKRHPTTTEY
jgi:hypothetical protein